MIKLELSYESFFSSHILYFLMGFTILDVFIDHILNKLIMGEALLVSPLLSSFIVTEFVMTMGANSFETFVISYFVETGLVVVSRTYVTPFMERMEMYLFRAVIKLAQRYRLFRWLFENLLRR